MGDMNSDSESVCDLSFPFFQYHIIQPIPTLAKERMGKDKIERRWKGRTLTRESNSEFISRGRETFQHSLCLVSSVGM